MQHKDVEKGHIHIMHNMEFTTLAEMANYIPNDEDLMKIVYCKEDKKFYFLENLLPKNWVKVGRENESTLPTVINLNNTESSAGWFRNGKEVFQIEVDAGAIPNSATKYISIPNYNNSYKYWIDIGKSYTRKNGTNECYALNVLSASGGAFIVLYLQINQIRLATNYNYSAYNETKIVLNYTKE